MNRFSLLHRAWRVAALNNDRRFAHALARPERTQLELLRNLIATNRTSGFGLCHSFARIDSVTAWRSRVPLSTGDDLAAHGPALLSGSSELTAEPVRRLLPTSGSTGTVKLVPWTDGMARAFAAGIDPWIADLMRRHPELTRGPSYWSVSPALFPSFPTAKVPIGFDDDVAYLGRWLEPLVDRVLLAPKQLRLAEDAEAFRYATLLLLLAARELRLVSVWHPTFFSHLWAARHRWWDDLLRDLESGSLLVESALGSSAGFAVRRRLRADPERAAELSRLGPQADACEIWPKLGVVSAWADGPAAAPMAALAEQIAPATAEPKGLLATEAMVTVPYRGRYPLALRSHYFEFRDESGAYHATHELRVGGRYEVIVSTQGGLYRYCLGDVVVVEGYLAATPSLRFVGRTDQRVDQVGEKLSDAFVRTVFDTALGSNSGFVRLAPSPPRPNEPPSYTLLVDSSISEPFDVSSKVLAELRRNPYFAQALDLGQLGPMRVFRVHGDAHDKWLEFESTCRPVGGIKPSSLGTRDDWENMLDGAELAPPKGDF